ncbi:hypothetical protein Tco_1449098 [Tanacetum coccineum]
MFRSVKCLCWLLCYVFCGAMTLVKFHCPFAGLNGCNDGGGNGLSKAYLIKHLWGIHCSGDAQAITKHSLLTDVVVFERAELTLKQIDIWLCGVCFKTHIFCTKCRHGSTFVSPPDNGDGEVHFVLYDLTRPLIPSCSQPDRVNGLLPVMSTNEQTLLSQPKSAVRNTLGKEQALPDSVRLISDEAL